MRIHCLQHVSFETPGTIAEWALQHHHEITYTNFFQKNFLLPPLADFDVLLIMGGSMNVDETDLFPWLAAEKLFIAEAIASGKKIIGICLGAQLLAGALGCKVYKGKEKEIGFLPARFSDEALQHPFFNHFSSDYTLFHWHGDTFDLPESAMVIASTAVCRHQAFLLGTHLLGLQFHLEMTEQTIEQMLLHDGNELSEKGNYIQTKETIRSGYTILGKNKRDLFTLLDAFFSNPGPYAE